MRLLPAHLSFLPVSLHVANLDFPTIWQSQSSQEAQVSRGLVLRVSGRSCGFLGPNLADPRRSAKVLSIAAMDVCPFGTPFKKECALLLEAGAPIASLQLAAPAEPLATQPRVCPYGLCPQGSSVHEVSRNTGVLAIPTPRDLLRMCQGCVPPVTEYECEVLGPGHFQANQASL